MLCMFTVSVSSYGWAFYYAGVEDFSFYSKLDSISAMCGLTFFPFIRLYFKSLTDESPLNLGKEFLWFLPALLVGVGSLIIYFYMGDERATAYMQAIFQGNIHTEEFSAPIYKVHFFVNIAGYYISMVVQIILVIRYILICLRSYRKKLDSFFSNPEGKSLETIKSMLVAILFLLIISLLSLLELYFFGHRYQLLIYLLFAGLTTTLYCFNYLVFSVAYTAENLLADWQQADKEAEEQGYATIEADEEGGRVSGIKKEKREKILLQLKRLLDEEEIFLQKNLRLDDVVRLVRANRTYISLLISEEYGCNFSELINGKRVAYAQKLARAVPDLLHAQVAEQSGFVHASTFSRVFKQRVGMTFKEWHQNL